MALSKYFNCINRSSKTPLPNPESFFSRGVNRAAIEAANEEVLKVHTEGLGAKRSRKRLSYLKATPAQKALVGKYAAEHSVMNSIRRFQKDFRENTLKFTRGRLLMFRL